MANPAVTNSKPRALVGTTAQMTALGLNFPPTGTLFLTSDVIIKLFVWDGSAWVPAA